MVVFYKLFCRNISLKEKKKFLTDTPTGTCPSSHLALTELVHVPACLPLRGPLRGVPVTGLFRACFLPPHVEDARPFAAVVSEHNPPHTLAESSDSPPGRLQLRLPKPGFPARRPLVTICGTLGILLRNHSAACVVSCRTKC